MTVYAPTWRGATRHASALETLCEAYEDALGEESPVWAELKKWIDEEAEREARDLQAAIDWQPKVRATGPHIDAATYDRLLLEIAKTDQPSFNYRLKLSDASPQRRRRYGEVVVADECSRVAGCEKGNRSNTLVSAAFNVGRLIPAGIVDPADAASRLLEAALTSGLSEREARGVLGRGLEAGSRNPRELT